MTNIKRITDEEIIALNTVRNRPCITESGECYIITTVHVYDDGEHFEIDRAHDTNVLATEREAREFVAKRMLSKDDSCYPIKHTYTIRCHHVF